MSAKSTNRSASVWNNKWKYVSSSRTDIRKLFNRIAPGWNKPPREQKTVSVIEMKKRRAA